MTQSVLRVVWCGTAGDRRTTPNDYLGSGVLALHDESPLPPVAAQFSPFGMNDNVALHSEDVACEPNSDSTRDVTLGCFISGTRSIVVAEVVNPQCDTASVVAEASIADVAVLVVEATPGVLPGTRWLTYLVSLVGVRQIIVMIERMDLVCDSEATATAVARECGNYASLVPGPEVTCIPVAMPGGDNVTGRSVTMSWYDGPTLLECLERFDSSSVPTRRPLRLPIKQVRRLAEGRHAAAGMIASGEIRSGARVQVLPGGKHCSVGGILIGLDAAATASEGQSVTVTLEGAAAVTRGDVIVDSDQPPQYDNRFRATVIWMHQHPLLPGRSYTLSLAGQTVVATISRLKYKTKVDTLEHVAASALMMNEVGACDIETSRPVVFEPYSVSRNLGGFSLLDAATSERVGVGMLRFALRRSQNLRWQPFDVDREARAELKAQKPCVVWFTGLSGAGKSTIANLAENRLYRLGYHTYVLDGDNIRHGLNKDLGFTEADRVENIRRVAEVARLMADAGLVVLVSFISPFRAERRMARKLLPEGEFFEVFVDAPLPVAEARDPKGLYKKARRGELKNFTGIDSPYEPPDRPELRLDTTVETPEQSADTVIGLLRSAGIIPL